MDQTAIQKMVDNKVEENLSLEYKAAQALSKTDSKKKEITKDVSAIDLSKLHLPENTQFNTIRFDFVDPVSFDYIYFLGIKKLSILMDEIKIGIEYSNGLQTLL